MMRQVVLSSRPVTWAGLAIVYLIGLHFGHGTLSALTVVELLAFSIPFAFVLFALNDAYDHESDSINTRRRSAVNHLLDPRHQGLAKRVGRAAAGLTLLVGAFASLRYGSAHLVFVVATVALGYAYSSPPFRLKERPVVDSLSNGGIMLGLLLIAFTTASPAWEAPRQLLAIAFGAVTMHALFAIADRDPDAHAKMRTIATTLGVRGAALLALLAGVALIGVGAFGSWFLIVGSDLVTASALATLLSGSTRVSRWCVQIISAYAAIAGPIYVASLML